MPDAGIPFALSSYRSESRSISAQMLQNFYCATQREGMDAKTPAALIGTPGLVQFARPGSGPIRAAIEMADELYVVSGTQLYHIAENAAVTVVGGGISPGSDVIGIATSGTEIVIVDGVRGFSYKPSGAGYQQILDVDFTAANTVTYVNGYFLFDRIGTNQFFSSDADNGASYDALFFSSAETNPDNVQGVVTLQQQLLIGGHKGIEMWQFNPNTAGFPWVRFGGVNISIGIAGPRAFTTHLDRAYFVSDDRIFYRMIGGGPEPLSDPGVAASWRAYSRVDDAVVWGMSWGLHRWIFVTFPTANRTWVFDDYTSFWHERVSHDENMVSFGRWRGAVYAKCYNRHFIGDAFTNHVGYLDDNTFTEYGNTIQSRAIAPAIHAKGKTIFMSSLEILMESGVGLTTGQGSDPKLILDWSDDDARTFRPFEMSRSFGKIGEHQKRVRFTDLGSFSQRNYRLTITDPVKRVIVSAVPKADIGLEYS